MAAERTMRLDAYVDLALVDVIERFARPDIDDVLATTMSAALEGRERVVVRTSPPERLTANAARIAVDWQPVDPAGRTRAGTASIQLLVVQSGKNPITELLVTLIVTDDDARPIAHATRRFLDRLTERLAASAA